MEVTKTLAVHDEPLARVAPFGDPKESEVEPANGAHVGEGAPVQVVEKTDGVATAMPVGRSSTKVNPFKSNAAFGFEIVNVKVDAPPTAI